MPEVDPLLFPVPHLPAPFLEVSHVAHRLRFSPEHVRRLIRGGQLPAIRFGARYRVDPVDLQAFIDHARNGNGHGT